MPVKISDTERGHRGVPSPGVGVLAAIEGAALIAWNLVVSPFVRRRRTRWGTIQAEATGPLPGDEFVSHPKWSTTLGIAIDAPPERVWPFVAQIGDGRGGFYSYQTLENMVGCKITNTTQILPDHQHPANGDDVYLCAGTLPLRVELVNPPHALVLVGAPVDLGSEETWGRSTWQFVARPHGDGGSRLLTRGRYDFASNWKSRLAFGNLLIEPISFVMSRRMMLEIERLAERNALARIPMPNAIEHEQR